MRDPSGLFTVELRGLDGVAFPEIEYEQCTYALAKPAQVS